MRFLFTGVQLAVTRQKKPSGQGRRQAEIYNRKHLAAMTSTPKSSPGVKTNSANCTNPEMDTFLRGHPLPKELAHLEDHVRKLPVRTFLEFLIDASLADMPLEDICACIKAAAKFYSVDSHRCAACLSWSKDVCGFTVLFDDEAVMITVCERCKRKVERKQATPAMERNLRSYIREGLRQ